MRTAESRIAIGSGQFELSSLGARYFCRRQLRPASALPYLSCRIFLDRSSLTQHSISRHSLLLSAVCHNNSDFAPLKRGGIASDSGNLNGERTRRELKKRHRRRTPDARAPSLPQSRIIPSRLIGGLSFAWDIDSSLLSSLSPALSIPWARNFWNAALERGLIHGGIKWAEIRPLNEGWQTHSNSPRKHGVSGRGYARAHSY